MAPPTLTPVIIKRAATLPASALAIKPAALAPQTTAAGAFNTFNAAIGTTKDATKQTLLALNKSK